MLSDVLVYHEPTNYLQGKFSMEFCLATALTMGKVGLSEITDEKVNDPRIRKLIKRVRLSFGGERAAPQDVVTLRLKDGREYSLGVERARGATEVPLTDEEIAAKYRDCAGLVLAEDKVEKTLDLMLNLEQLGQVSELMKMVGAVKSG